MEEIIMAKTINEKLAQAQLEKQQAEARIKQLQQEQKAAERKARNHRFCKRGGLMENLLPNLALLTDEQFETFFKNTTANSFGRKALAELVPPPPAPPPEAEGGADAGQGNADTGQNGESTAQAAARTEHNPVTKSVQTAKPQGTADGSRTGDAARVAG
jgi:hypothetical protein